MCVQFGRQVPVLCAQYVCAFSTNNDIYKRDSGCSLLPARQAAAGRKPDVSSLNFRMAVIFFVLGRISAKNVGTRSETVLHIVLKFQIDLA